MNIERPIWSAAARRLLMFCLPQLTADAFANCLGASSIAVINLSLKTTAAVMISHVGASDS